MSDILFWSATVYVAGLFVTSYLFGAFESHRDAESTMLFVGFWPLVLLLLVVAMPLVAVHDLGIFTASKIKSRSKQEIK